MSPVLTENIELLVNGKSYTHVPILAMTVEHTGDGIPERVIIQLDVKGERLRREAQAMLSVRPVL